jgi:hypothetical protein
MNGSNISIARFAVSNSTPMLATSARLASSFGYALGVSPQNLMSDPGHGSVIAESPIVDVSSTFVLMSVASGTSSSGASEFTRRSVSLGGTAILLHSFLFGDVCSPEALSPSPRLTSSEAGIIRTAFELSTGVSESIIFGLKRRTGVQGESRLPHRSNIVFSELREEMELFRDSNRLFPSDATQETKKDGRAPSTILAWERSSTVWVTALIKESIALGLSKPLTVSQQAGTAFHGNSDANRGWSTLAVSAEYGAISPLDLSAEFANSRLNWNTEIPDVSIHIRASQIVRNTELLPSRFYRSAECSFELGPNRPGSIGRGDFPANADSALRGNNAAGLGAGLGVGLFILILLVCGVLYWFARRRRAEPKDQEDPTEIHSTDTWDENLDLVSGENTLASERIAPDEAFTERPIVALGFE